MSLPFLTLLTLVVQLIKKNQTKHIQPSCLLYVALLTVVLLAECLFAHCTFYMPFCVCLVAQHLKYQELEWMRDEGFTHIQNNHKEILINAAIHYGTLLAIM